MPTANLTQQQPAGIQGFIEPANAVAWLAILHDLRNPLSTICAGSEMLMCAGEEPGDFSRIAANIHEAAGRMRELLSEMSRSNFITGSLVEACKVREIIEEAVDASCAATNYPLIKLYVDASKDVEVRCMRSRLKRVFLTLITNALEAILGPGEIRLAVKKSPSQVLVEIEDTGPGIPEEIRSRIFEPFVTAGKPHGLGLGLAISRRTVMEHGGEIWAEAGSGARFVVCLPTD